MASGIAHDDATYRSRLRDLLAKLAYERREVTLASGAKSTFYVDCKQATLTAEGHDLVGRVFLRLLMDIEKEGAPHVACSGMSIGADPLCSALALTAYRDEGRDLGAVFVRKEPKGHGTGAFLEGTKNVPDGARLILLEDVITTGGSTLRACERVREGGYEVDHVLCLVDRGAGGREALADAQLKLHALFSPADFENDQ